MKSRRGQLSILLLDTVQLLSKLLAILSLILGFAPNLVSSYLKIVPILKLQLHQKHRLRQNIVHAKTLTASVEVGLSMFLHSQNSKYIRKCHIYTGPYTRR